MRRALLAAGLAALAGLVALRATGTERGTLLVLLVGVLPVVLLAAWPLLGLAVRWRAPGAALAAAGLVAVQALLVAPSLTAAPPPPPGGTPLRVVVANLYVRNPVPVEAAAVLRALEPDVLVVPELDARGRAALQEAGVEQDLPHVVVESAGGEAVGLLSRTPLRDVVLRRAGARVLPQATVDAGGPAVRVHAAHPLPPVGGLEPLWRAGHADLARQAAGEDLTLVVAGDLNAGRHHAVFRRLAGTGLRDAHDERGRPGAGEAAAALPLLHLDHVLVRDGRDGRDGRIGVREVREVRLPGSDHLAVVADLVVHPA
ncbi:MAG TPA: endonuclease/exonuclease/phosphatase family protein [Mycobacteriales bacterium]|nr:endonuclease/exonuclease/phosphatase family protein [Mycobacteriales bacterium]